MIVFSMYSALTGPLLYALWSKAFPISILGPILFLVYIYELPHVCKNFRVILFANDTAFLYRNSSLNSCMPRNLQWLQLHYEVVSY